MEERAGSKAGVVAAIVASLLFALFLTILPRLSAGDEDTPAAADAVPGAAEPARNTTGPEGSSEAVTPTTTSTTTSSPTTTTTTSAADEVRITPEPSPFVIPPPPGENADLRLAVSVDAGAEEKESVMVFEGDDLVWTLRVTNAGDEYLWGVYAHLEGYGRMTCDRRRLDSGETALCTATTPAVAGDQVAWLWATAWTTTAIIGTDTVYPYVVMA